MKRATLVLSILSLLVGGGRAKAGFIYGTARVSDFIDNASVNGGPKNGVPVSASASISATYADDTGNAVVSLVPPPGLSEGLTWQLHTDAQASWYADISSHAANVILHSTAIWQDVLVLGNTDPALVGNTLRLNFYADISLSNSSVADAGTVLIASGTNISNPSRNDMSSSSFGTSLSGPFWGSQFLTTGSWDSMQDHGDGSYEGTFHLDIPIHSGEGYLPGEPGSVYYSLLDESRASGQSSWGVASAGDPSGFMSITLPDVGNVTPESLGVSVTFQSGIASPDVEPSAVPEPVQPRLGRYGARLPWLFRLAAKANRCGEQNSHHQAAWPLLLTVVVRHEFIVGSMA